MEPWHYLIEEILDYMESPEFLALNEKYLKAGYLENESCDDEPYGSSEAFDFLELDTRPILH